MVCGKELLLDEYASEVASMAGEYGEISITASGELVIDPMAEAFLTGYSSNMTPQEYQLAFDFFRGEGNIFDRRQWRMKGENGGRSGRRWQGGVSAADRAGHRKRDSGNEL